MDFALGLRDFILHLPDGQVTVWANFFGLGKVTLTRIHKTKRDSYIKIGREKS